MTHASASADSKIVIIGAGPTGLGAGYCLKELGHTNFQIYEQSSHAGGLAASVTDAGGFTWDIGVHVTHSHYPYFDRVYDRLMGNDFRLHRRECWIRAVPEKGTSLIFEAEKRRRIVHCKQTAEISDVRAP